MSNYPPGVTGSEYAITGECSWGCRHCAGDCGCEAECDSWRHFEHTGNGDCCPDGHLDDWCD